ncbi:hypothetical protein HHI36_001387 [Cryptolaemus montrouzieri]|uniref:Reverse transcriptase n=1 Tax=Cryptolaemus montrouzieri TaxID=559131 RepID=A0ABD2P866_9CUCU
MIYSYSKSHSLKINLDKTQAICFGDIDITNVRPISINRSVISCSRIVKSLGVFVGQNMRFREHILLICKKSYMALRSLYLNNDVLNPSLRRALCESLVLSHANYADVLYGPCLDVVSSNRIQKIQNCYVRFILSLPRRENISPKLREFG